MKKLIAIVALFISGISFAQVPKKVIVEHFTNTWCSICASRNPGFYTNLNSQPGILHIAYHPSAPYTGCILNQHNKSQNDGRTKFYGIYGSTPRLVINGGVISPATNYSSSSIFTPYLGQTSPFEISILQNKLNGTDMVQQIKIKAVAVHSYNAAKLYVAIAEDTLFYTGPNGEPKHFDVFRKALTDSSGLTVNVPVNIGDSLVLNYSTPINGAWTIGKLLSVAILQETGTNAVIQAEKTIAAQNDLITTVGIMEMPQVMQVTVMPNPAKDFITVKIPSVMDAYQFKIIDLLGHTVMSAPYTSTSIDVKNLKNGIYFLSIIATSNTQTIKLLIE